MIAGIISKGKKVDKADNREENVNRKRQDRIGEKFRKGKERKQNGVGNGKKKKGKSKD